MMLLLVIVLALALIAALGALGWRTRLPIRRQRVLINLDDDTAVRGVLLDARDAWLVLHHAELLQPAQEPATLDGETWLPRTRVLFLQVMP